MKYWKLNSILIILIIYFSYVYSVAETSKNSESFSLNNFETNTNQELENMSLENLEKELNKEVVENSEKGNLEKEYLNLIELNQLQIKNNKNSKNNNTNKINKPTKNIKGKTLKNIIIKKKEIPRPKYKIENNPRIPKDPKQLLKDVSYIKCQQKSGYLYLSRNVFPAQNKPMLIKVVPVYAFLTRGAFTLAMGPEEKSLFYTINLGNILKITQRYQNSFCFDIVENTIYEKSLTKGPITLCSKDQKEMENWITSLQEFKECNINVYTDPKSQNKVLVDFEKVNQLLKDKHKNENNKEASKTLYYKKESPYIPNPQRVEKEKQINKTLKQIIQTIETGNIAQNRIRRTMSSKVKTAEKFAYDIRKKQELINIMMQKRLAKEKDREAKLISIEHRARELQLLKAVQQRIRQYKIQEMKDYQTIISTRITEIKERANEDAKIMMRTLIDQQKLSPYEECYDDRLFLFKDKRYIHGVCFRLYGENRGESCEDKKDFCNMCCDFHVGIRYSNKLYECKQRCTKVINGLVGDQNLKKNENTLDKTKDKIKDKNLKKDKNLPKDKKKKN